MKYTYKYRIYPTKRQSEILQKQFSLCCSLYNTCLEQKRFLWNQRKKSVSKYDQKSELPELKTQIPEYKEIHSQVLQDTILRVDKTYQNFFRGSGFPRFKSIDRFHSITYPQIYKLKFKNNRIFIPKIGYVKIKLHRELPISAKIKLFHITHHCNQYHICIMFELPDVPKKLIDYDKAVAIDMGIQNFVRYFVRSGEDGTIIYPKFLRKSEGSLKKAHQELSRKQRGSHNRIKTKQKLAKIYNKVTNQRNNFLHKTSHWFAKKFDIVFHEDLNIQRMLRGRHAGLKKSIIDSSWNKFLNQISYKVENTGGYAIKVDPENTSQICSKCGMINKMQLWNREYICECGFQTNRDLNAARNIFRLGTSLLIKREAHDFNRG